MSVRGAIKSSPRVGQEGGGLSERVGAKVREKGDNSSVNGARERMKR